MNVARMSKRACVASHPRTSEVCLLCSMTQPVLTDGLSKVGVTIAVTSFLHNKELWHRGSEIEKRRTDRTTQM